MAKLNTPNIAAQIASQLVSNVTQQLIGGLLPLAQEMANKDEACMKLLRQLKSGDARIEDVTITDDGFKVIPKRPASAEVVDKVVSEMSNSKKPVEAK